MPSGIYPHKPLSEKKRKKFLEYGQKYRFKKGHKPYKFWLGKKFPLKLRKKLSEAHKGQEAWNKGLKYKGKPCSEETKRKISKANKNKKRTEETKKLLSKIRKGKHNSPNTEFKKGHESNFIGEKNGNWKGGISFEPYPINWKEKLKENIRKRDNHICQLCGIHQNQLKGFHRKLDVHHIDYDKKNCYPKNLITLCRHCHCLTNNYRNYWLNYFKNNKYV